MLFTTVLITALLAAAQLPTSHASFTHAIRSNLDRFRASLQDDSQSWPKLDSSPTPNRSLKTSLLEPRAIGSVAIPNHWTVTLETFNAFLEGAVDIGILAELYAEIEAYALALQNQVTQHPTVIFQFGNLELVFFSAVGHVPWSLVRNFAVLMQAVTARGLAGFFQARATHLSGVTVFADLRLA